MRSILHVVTQKDDGLAREMAAGQMALPECQVELVDLTQPRPDYALLAQKIFAADSVQVW